MIGGHLRLLGDGAADELGGALPFTALEAGQAEEVERVGVARLLLDDALVEAPGARQLPRPVQPHGHLQQLRGVLGRRQPHLARDARLSAALSPGFGHAPPIGSFRRRVSIKSKRSAAIDPPHREPAAGTLAPLR